MGLSEGHLGPVLCRSGALLDCLEALSDGCGAIWEPPRLLRTPRRPPSWSVGKPKRREPQNSPKT
eukprot:9476381-Pyramimonas_sp.AAC.1